MKRATKKPRPAPRRCRICGCSQENACVNRFGEPCHWVEPNLCSSCAEIRFAMFGQNVLAGRNEQRLRDGLVGLAIVQRDLSRLKNQIDETFARAAIASAAIANAKEKLSAIRGRTKR